MIKTVFILLIFNAFCADEIKMKDLETKNIIYSSRTGFHFQSYLAALKRGYPLGHVIEKENPSPERITSLTEIIQGLDTAIKEIQTASRKTQEEMSSSFLTGDPGDLLPQPFEQPIVIESFYSIEKFKKCALKTLPLLKKLLRYKKSDDDFNYRNLENEISKERGNGSVVDPMGISCGKYLGPLGTINPGEKLEIQILSTLSLFNHVPTELLTYFSIYSRILNGNSVDIAPFWEMSWKDISFGVLFYGSAVRSVDKLIVEFIEDLGQVQSDSILKSEHGGTMKINVSTDGVRERILDVWEKHWKEVSKL